MSNREELDKFVANGGARRPESKKNGKKVPLTLVSDVQRPDDDSSDFLKWAGSPRAAEQWAEVFFYLAESVEGHGAFEDGIFCEPELLWSFTVSILNGMGVKPPKRFPARLEGAIDCCWEAFEENPYTNLITHMYESLVSVHEFYLTYVDELIEYDDEGFDSQFENIQPCLLDLAASKVECTDQKFAPKFHAFRHDIQKKYRHWLTRLKEHSVRMGRPLRAEIMDLVNADNDQLDIEVEEYALGDNEHLDIYMNELLVGMREIRRILPKIVEKLGIDLDAE